MSSYKSLIYGDCHGITQSTCPLLEPLGITSFFPNASPCNGNGLLQSYYTVMCLCSDLLVMIWGEVLQLLKPQLFHLKIMNNNAFHPVRY